ncbi:DUF4192 family protein [Microbacterium yannicii]|uniref:DUF4192 family protein n=1 Tax=Microbacterium yannicii TaxID=671622 RepID=UPI00031362E0|nr:DUF4192 family protein [Microbacterium yannicii]
MTSTIVKAADAAQFLAFVPRMLGYQPSRSLVMIPFHGSRSLGAMRFDLPESAHDGEDAVDRIASTVIGMTCRLPEADAVATIVYTDATFAGGGMPHHEIAAALERRADACGLRMTDALWVAADGWGSYLDPACPDAGRPLAELGSTSSALAGIPEPSGDQASGADLPHHDLAERERTGRALAALNRAVGVLCGEDAASEAGVKSDTADHDGGDPIRAVGSDAGGSRNTRWAGRRGSASSADLAPVPPPMSGEARSDASGPADQERVDPHALVAVCLLDDLPDLFEGALTWDVETLSAYETAALVWCLSRPSLRDIALVQWSGDFGEGDDALDAQLRWESGEEYPADLAMRMWGEGERPDPARLETALQLVRHVAALAPRLSRPGPLAMCAWLSWALGRSTHAEAYATQACEIEPEHGLSEIVLSFVHAGHLPDWAFRRTA